MLSVILCPRDLHISSQKLERKYMYIGFEPKAITADAGASKYVVHSCHDAD